MTDQAAPEFILATWRQELEQQHPRVARALNIAAARRRSAAKTWKPSGGRLTGIEELLLHLDAVASVSAKESKHGRAIASLVRRMARDFETALEAGLSGYTSVALDAMRDVMEATDLILMFSTDLKLIEAWVETPRDQHWKAFSPRAVRKHLLKHGLKYKDNARATIDYQGHSMALHVGPWRIPLADRGLLPEGPLTNDAHFWEIYYHARELIFALQQLRDAGGLDWGGVKRAEDLNDVRVGYERSMEMQALFFALWESFEKAESRAESKMGAEVAGAAENS